MFCNNCGKQIEDSSNFCIFCGVSLKGEPAVAPSPEGAEYSMPQQPQQPAYIPQQQVQTCSQQYQPYQNYASPIDPKRKRISQALAVFFLC